MKKNIVAFQKGMIIPVNDAQNNRIMVSTMQIELLKLGYILTENAFASLSKSDPSFIEEWFNDVVNYLKEWLDKEKHQTIYKSFQTVIDTSLEQLFYQQLYSYWHGGAMNFDDTTKEQIKYEEVEWKEIKLGTEEDFKNIFKKLAQTITALMPQDFVVIEWFAKEYRYYNMPNTIPFKENLCMLAALGLNVPVKTPTDVLRIAFYFSTGKSDLIIPPKQIYFNRSFRDNPERKDSKWKLTNPEKRIVMNLLEKVADIAVMKERKKMWRILAHHLHPTKFEEIYPKAVNALRTMDRKHPMHKKIKTFNSKVHNAPDLEIKLHFLKQRPGTLARMLNALLFNEDNTKVLIAFQEVGINISNKVLFEVITYFEGRTIINNDRKVFIPGSKKPVKLPTLPVMSEAIVDNIENTIWDILSAKFVLLDSLGKVYLDEELKKIPLPANLRNMEESLTPIIRGQRMPLALNKRYAIIYAAWEGRSDLDVSASIITKNGDLERVGWNASPRLKGITFSGDNTGNYQYNSEMICVDMENTNIKYVLFHVNVYSGGTFANIKSIVGIMSRNDVFVSKQYKPETVQHAIRPTCNLRQLNAFIFDVETKEWLIIDEADDNQVASQRNIVEYINTIATLPKISVYDLMLLHVAARAKSLVSTIEEADTVFMFDDFSKDYTETIKYML